MAAAAAAPFEAAADGFIQGARGSTRSGTPLDHRSKEALDEEGIAATRPGVGLLVGGGDAQGAFFRVVLAIGTAWGLVNRAAASGRAFVAVGAEVGGIEGALGALDALLGVEVKGSCCREACAAQGIAADCWAGIARAATAGLPELPGYSDRSCSDAAAGPAGDAHYPLAGASVNPRSSPVFHEIHESPEIPDSHVPLLAGTPYHPDHARDLSRGRDHGHVRAHLGCFDLAHDVHRYFLFPTLRYG